MLTTNPPSLVQLSQDIHHRVDSALPTWIADFLNIPRKLLQRLKETVDDQWADRFNACFDDPTLQLQSQNEDRWDDRFQPVLGQQPPSRLLPIAIVIVASFTVGIHVVHDDTSRVNQCAGVDRHVVRDLLSLLCLVDGSFQLAQFLVELDRF